MRGKEEALVPEVVTQSDALPAVRTLGIAKRPETAINTAIGRLAHDFLEVEPNFPRVEFLRYPDGRLQLFKPGQILGAEPAGYSENQVVIKGRVTFSSSEDFAVVLPTSRIFLDQPGAEEYMAQLALSWRK